MSGRFRNVRRKPRSSARAASFEPGSVIATKREPSRPVAWKKYSSITSGSSVEPDFEAITNSEPSTGTACTASGSVVSSTCSRPPNASPSTSGARLEPPMPHSTTRSKPRIASVAQAWI